jgi:hypothetical protein
MNINQMMELSFAFMEFDQDIRTAGDKASLGILLQKSNGFLNAAGLVIALDVKHSESSWLAP